LQLLFINLCKKIILESLDWKGDIPWGMYFKLFGGGMALAEGFSETGLAQWIALQMTQMQGASICWFWILVIVASSWVNFFNRNNFNLVTTAMLLPVLAPWLLHLTTSTYDYGSVTISASCICCRRYSSKCGCIWPAI
jgi:sodium-dependent dicarboxylate transporter 2/3/5